MVVVLAHASALLGVAAYKGEKTLPVGEGTRLELLQFGGGVAWRLKRDS
jgi:hypothetical protein